MSNTELLMEEIRTLPAGFVDEVLQFVANLKASNSAAAETEPKTPLDEENERIALAMIKEYYRTANSPRTTEEAIQQAEARAKDPNRKPFSRHIGSFPGFFGGIDGVAYQRKLRDEWD